MSLTQWEIQHRKNIQSGIGQVDRLLTMNANSVALKIKNLQAKQAIRPEMYGTQILRNQELQKQISKEFFSLEGNLNKTLAGLTRAEWNLANKKNDAELLKYALPETAIPVKWTNLNLKAYDQFANRNINGLNLSDRIHNITEQNKQLYLDYIGSGITQGKSASEIATELNKINRDPSNVVTFDKRGEISRLGLTSKLITGNKGVGIYNTPRKNLMRVTRQETNVAYRLSDYIRWQQLDFVVGIQVYISNSHPKLDMCDYLMGKYPKDFKFYGWHILCLCYATSILATPEEMNYYLKTGQMRSNNEVTAIPNKTINWIANVGKAAEKYEFMGGNPKYLKGMVEKTIQAKALSVNAAVNKDSFDALSRKVAKQTGSTVTNVNLKGVSRIVEKSVEYKTMEQVPDAIRNTIITRKENIEAVIAKLNKEFDVLRVKRQNLETGYSGTIVNVKLPNGVIGEIQVNTPQMIYAKDTNAKSFLGEKVFNRIAKETNMPSGLGHSIYEEIRTLNTDLFFDRIKELNKKSFEYYLHFK